MKELKRKQDEDELRRREEASRYSVGTDKTDGEKSEAGSIKSGGKKITLTNILKVLSSTFIIIDMSTTLLTDATFPLYIQYVMFF